MLAVAQLWRLDPRRILLVLLAVQMGDWATTTIGISAWGTGVETNGLIVSLWSLGGSSAYFALKLAAVALAGIGMWFGTTCDDAPVPTRLLVAVSVTAMLAFGILTGVAMVAQNLTVIAAGLLLGIPFV